MYDIRVDAAKNRIYLTLDGFFYDEEAQECATAFKAGIDQLQPGFVVISDLRKFKPASPQAVEHIVDCHRYEIDRGIYMTVRIVGEHTLGTFQFERISRKTGVPVVNVATLAEAETLLDQESVHG